VRVDILSVDKFIEVNKCPQVTNPVGLDAARRPTTDGLFSFELFGSPGSYDRRTIFGYVDLGKRFLHPLVYRILVGVDRRIASIVDGSRSFKVEAGELVEDQNGETGLDFLYRAWGKVRFASTESARREDKLTVIASLKKEEAFCSKWPVIPAFLRDVNLKTSSSRITVDEINELYSKLIGAASSLDADSGFDFMGRLTEARIQQLLLDLYTLLTQKLAHKNGYIHQYLMGKNVDYAVRGVISAPRISSETWEGQQVRYVETGVPLAQACNLFFPFIVKEIQTFFESHFTSEEYVDVGGPGGPDRVRVDNPLQDYTPDTIKKLVSIFIKSPENRFQPVTVRTEIGQRDLWSASLERPITLTDLLYVCASAACSGKHVYVTRYPIEHHQNIYTTRVKIISTHKTEHRKVGGVEYPDYPSVPWPASSGGPDNEFIDTTLVNNSYLDALGGDYDGDQVSLHSIFSQEANEECEKIIFSKRNILNGNGQNIRRIAKEAALTMYALTRD
jgi:DNA-directed RNA polymerase beta' subunit